MRLQDEDTSIILIPPKYVKEYTPVSEELNEKTEETNIIEENKYEIIRLKLKRSTNIIELLESQIKVSDDRFDTFQSDVFNTLKTILQKKPDQT